MRAEARDPRALIPLTPLAVQVLLALDEGPRHGYRIIQEVTRRTDGLIRLRTGTLDTLLQRLSDEAIIEPEETADRTDPSGRRRHYRLTPFGRRVLQAEAKRLEALVLEARRARVLDRPAKA